MPALWSCQYADNKHRTVVTATIGGYSDACKAYLPTAAAGHELGNDARTLELPVWDNKNRNVVTATNRAVVTAVVSPEPNAYSLAPAEFRAVYEQASVSWMLAQAVSNRV
jgi:hypothetical protein